MIQEKDVSRVEFICPHCKGNKFVLIGLQKQNGLFKDHELWSCKHCHSTFARETIEAVQTTENENFKKKALQYYRRVNFA